MQSKFDAWKYPLRDWQEEAWARYQRKTNKSFLAVATPGAGKTMFALRVAYEALATNKANRIAIVAPTRHLCTQWSVAAHRVGLNISVFDNQRMNERRDSHGFVSTYQSVASNPELYALLCCRQQTLTIMDEIHHAGEHLTWGTSLTNAFSQSVSILALSGTPFRSDNAQIPFVRYVEGISQSDYAYTYKQSLIDGVCRTVLFPTFEGNVAYLQDGEYRSVSFSDDLSEKMARQRLLMSGRTDDYVEGLVREADETLRRLRSNQQPNAGGLLIAQDIQRAKQARDIIRKVTGTEPFLATSDTENDGSEQIKRFTKSQDPWIVAVKMISEGVDIPRLRVLVYATNTTAEMFFRQAVGRVVRVMPKADNPTAFVYMPKDPELAELAKLIVDERGHEIEEFDGVVPGFGLDEECGSPRVYAQLIPHTGNAVPSDTIYMGDQYDKAVLPDAENIGKQLGIATPALQVVLNKYLQTSKKPGDYNSNSVFISSDDEDLRTMDEKTEHLQKIVNSKVKQLAGYIKGNRELGETIKVVWKFLRQKGFHRLNRCSYGELQEIIAYLDRELQQYSRGVA